jgi:hypothetical protein
MSQLSAPASNLFRKSLREWQAGYKAKQTALAVLTGDEAPAPAPTREKRLVSRKRRARKPAGMAD